MANKRKDKLMQAIVSTRNNLLAIFLLNVEKQCTLDKCIVEDIYLLEVLKGHVNEFLNH